MTGETRRMPRRLARSRTDRLLGGVCGGLAASTGLDPLVLRVAAVALTLAGGAGVLLYVLAWLVLPEEGTERSLAQAAAADRRLDVGEVRPRAP